MKKNPQKSEDGELEEEKSLNDFWHKNLFVRNAVKFFFPLFENIYALNNFSGQLIP